MRNTIKATVLTLILAMPVLAGEMGAPIAPPDGRQAQSSSMQTKTGDIGCPIAASEITMTLLRTLLVLF